jgi:hypothetical protein
MYIAHVMNIVVKSANCTMANSVNLSQNAALHQMRISQIPLRPSEQGNVSACGQNLLIHSQEEHPESVEKLSSLDHVRYNIVGKWVVHAKVIHECRFAVL